MKGQIRKALSGFYYIYAEGKIYQTRARGNFRKLKLSPLVGDEVIFESTSQTDGYILELLPRKNELVRPAVANVDQAVIVTSLVEPDFSFNLLDRFLVTLAYRSIKPIIYITKVDLVNEDSLIQAIQATYQPIGYKVIIAKDNREAIDELEALFPNRLTVFMGQSGAGKSTLLNQILPELELKTGEISDALGRGRHTTRHVELLEIAGGLVADTPGFSAIDFLSIDATELPREFPEFVALLDQCRFRECQHLNEPDCAIKDAVARGAIAQSRYENYQQFMAEIEHRRPIYKKKK
ncbi:ribosome small subunit-dependent GTPase A [Enterococcus camelliae]|uniref:Small ribosomal subunit biogenesis GTPase RsgA n=1 Tax=Enterococcus camelliae TaxID=453959 RepID=A0ABW5TH04_9ENTE